MPTAEPLIIVGGGLAGALAALELARLRPEQPLLLLEAGGTFGGNHTWSFFDDDVPATAAPLLAALSPHRWPRHCVKFAKRQRLLPLAYNSVTSAALDAAVRVQLASAQWRTGCPVHSIAPDGVTLADGTWLAASAMIDARGWRADDPPGLELGWQKFVGIEFAATAPNLDCPTIMDATVPQDDGYRFVYTLPFGPDRVLVEDTYYQTGPHLDAARVAARVRAYAAAAGLAGPELRQEAGVLPLAIGGDPAAFWPADDPVGRLGMAGGFFHATTGYSLGLAVRLAGDLARLEGELGSARLAAWSRQAFLAHWRAMGFYRLLNRMVFRAAQPAERSGIFAHFYRLPPPLIARFYAGRLTMLDKARILSGRPPLPIGRALRAMRR